MNADQAKIPKVKNSSQQLAGIVKVFEILALSVIWQFLVSKSAPAKLSHSAFFFRSAQRFFMANPTRLRGKLRHPAQLLALSEVY